MVNYVKLLNNLEVLNLEKIRSILSEYLDEVSKNNISFVDALTFLTDKEIVFKDKRASIANIKVAAFPFERSLDDFDFDFQPSINKNTIMDLASLRFIEKNENILFLGSSGVGKTHLSTAIGRIAAANRYSTYFINFQKLISTLSKAHYENKFDQKLLTYSKYKVLIVDEIGYLPIDKQGANLFFQLISKRYEKKSTIITTNQSFSKWGEIFGDPTLANAILDRLVHHSKIIKIAGPSYRIKDKISLEKPTKM